MNATRRRTSGRRRASGAALLAGLLAGAAAPPALAQAGATDLDAIEAQIKAPETPESLAAMRGQAAALGASSRAALSTEAALRASSTIYISHNRSLIEEAFYHLEQIAPYADYDQRLYLRKLQSLKANKDRYDLGEIDQGRFEAAVARADRVHARDVDEARDYLAQKAERLDAICVNLSQNVEALRESLEAARMKAVPRGLAERVTPLRSHQTWIDFTTPTGTGRQMLKALEQAEAGDPQAIASCIAGAFTAYEANPGGAVADGDLVRKLVEQFK